MFKFITAATFVFFAKASLAQMQLLPLPNNGAFGAIFPCKAEKKSVSSTVGITNSLQCRVDNSSSVCVFITTEQPLDIQSFNRYGWKFIEEVNKQYASQMDRNFTNVSGKLVDMGGLGKGYTYEFVRLQDGMQVNVKGMWLVSHERMLRGTVSCAPNQTNFMKKDSDIFLKSLSILK